MLQQTNPSSESFSVSFFPFPLKVEEAIASLKQPNQTAPSQQSSQCSFHLRCAIQFLERSSFCANCCNKSSGIVVQTAWKVGKDGIEAGTNLVPDSVPRPIARISVTVVALTLALFVLKSFLSTAFFVLATMGLIYFVFIALNKDEGPRGGGGGGTTSTTSTEDSLEEARRIMEKYK